MRPKILGAENAYFLGTSGVYVEYRRRKYAWIRANPKATKKQQDAAAKRIREEMGMLR